MAGECGRKREFERWPEFKRLWLQAFNRCIKAREEARCVQRFKSAEEWFEWWLSDEAMEKPISEDQLVLDGF